MCVTNGKSQKSIHKIKMNLKTWREQKHRTPEEKVKDLRVKGRGTMPNPSRVHDDENYKNKQTNKLTNSVALVRERTIPTERPPPVGEVSANFCG